VIVQQDAEIQHYFRKATNIKQTREIMHTSEYSSEIDCLFSFEQCGETKCGWGGGYFT
jgi:hypothetical protein